MPGRYPPSQLRSPRPANRCQRIMRQVRNCIAPSLTWALSLGAVERPVPGRRLNLSRRLRVYLIASGVIERSRNEQDRGEPLVVCWEAKCFLGAHTAEPTPGSERHALRHKVWARACDVRYAPWATPARVRRANRTELPPKVEGATRECNTAVCSNPSPWQRAQVSVVASHSRHGRQCDLSPIFGKGPLARCTSDRRHRGPCSDFQVTS